MGALGWVPKAVSGGGVGLPQWSLSVEAIYTLTANERSEKEQASATCISAGDAGYGTFDQSHDIGQFPCMLFIQADREVHYPAVDTHV